MGEEKGGWDVGPFWWGGVQGRGREGAALQRPGLIPRCSGAGRPGLGKAPPGLHLERPGREVRGESAGQRETEVWGRQ